MSNQDDPNSITAIATLPRLKNTERSGAIAMDTIWMPLADHIERCPLKYAYVSV